MIRIFKENDLASVMQIWLDTNIKAHNFIPKAYWTDNYAAVTKMLPQAEVYVYEDDSTHQILGFIGLTGSCIAGIFVKECAQSNGIGKQLLNHAKTVKTNLSLNVYQKNVRAVLFYQRENFFIKTENLNDSTNEYEFIMEWRGND